MAVEELTIRASMRDELSARVRAVRAEMAGLEKDVAKLGTTGATVAEPGLARVETRGRSLSDMTQGLRGRISGLSDDLWSMVVNGTEKAVIGLGALGLVVGGFGLKSAATFEQARLSMDTFFGSAQKGDQVMAQLRALQGPFDIKTLAEATQNIQTAGAGADRVIPRLKAIANIAAVQMDPNSAFAGISEAVNRMQETGRIEPRALLAFARNGVDVYGLLAEKLGVARNQVKLMVESGQMTSETFLQAFDRMEGPLAKFQAGLDNSRNTLTGMWGQLKATVQQHLADAAGPLAGALKLAMPQITTAVGALIDQVGPPVFTMLGSLAKVLVDVLPLVAPILGAAATGLGRILGAFAPALALLAPKVPAIADAVVKLVTALLPLAPSLGRLLVAMAPLAVTILGMTTTLVTMLLPVITPIIDGLASLTTNSAGFRDVLGGIFLGLMAFKAVASVTGIVKDFSSAIAGLATKMGILAAAETDEAVARTAGGGAGVGQGGSAGLGVLGGIGMLGAGVGLAGTGMLGHKGHPTIAGDLSTVGGFALAGAGLGSIIPGAGTLAGGLIGAGVGGLAVGAHHLLANFGGASSHPAGGNVVVHAPVTVSPALAQIYQDPQFQTYLTGAIQQYQADRAARG